MDSKSQSKASKSKPSKREAQTMGELLSMYGGSGFSHSVGDRVRGKILSIDGAKVVIDIGGKSEGMVAEKAFKEAEEFIKTLKIGDEIETTVLVPETNEGFTILSLRVASENSLWGKIQDASEKATPITVEGLGVTSSGVTVNLNGLTGFIPMSQLGKVTSQNPQALIGKKFQAVVIDYSRNIRKMVLSEKEVTEAGEIAQGRTALKEIKEGQEFEEEVTTIYDFGAFVRIWTKGPSSPKDHQPLVESSGREVPLKGKVKANIPLEGLVHVSELSWEKISDPGSVVSVGQKVKVVVVGKKNDKLAFSIKQREKDPWDEVATHYTKDKKVEGVVSKLTDFGVFVSLEKGVEGLIHITKIPPEKSFSRGDKVQVYIEEVDAKARRISLGLILTAKPVGYK